MASLRTYKGKRGTTYSVRWRERDGDRWREERETFDRLTDAKQYRATIEANGNRRPLREPDPGTLTVPRLVEQYIDDRERRVRSDRTTADYRRDLETWLVVPFARVDARDLSHTQVQAWVDGIDRAPKTVKNIHGLLSAAYKWGLSRGLVGLNPCAGTELPRVRKRVVRGLRPGEWTLLYRAACARNPDAADLLLFLVNTGWRFSEATALQVMHCDLDRETPRVEVAGVHRRNAAGEIKRVEDAKSDAGLRTVALGPELAEMLRRRTLGKALGEYVFTGATGLPWRYNNFHQREWKPIIEAARKTGLVVEPKIHDLRHTHAAMMIQAGANLAAVKARMGHESITTTVNTYGSLVGDVPVEIVAQVEGALSPRPNLHVAK